MAQYLSNELAGTTTGTTTSAAVGYKPAASVYCARMKRIRATITYASQADGSTVVLGEVPAGYSFAYGILTASASSGSTTIAVGTAASAAKYKAAAAFTSTDTPTFFGKAAAVAGDVYSSTEVIIATLAAAAAPSSGTLVIDLYFSAP